MNISTKFFFLKNLLFASFISFTLAVITGCKTNDTGKALPQEVASQPEDSLYNAIIALHDAAMPKMGKLMGATKALQQKIDSLDVVTKIHGSKAASKLKQQYIDLQSRLKTAEKEMMDWMEGFDPDPKLASKQQLLDYFEKQKASAQKMKDDVFAALDSANARLK